MDQWNEEQEFLKGLLVSGGEGADARLVYADWLEEHGDARAEFLRLDLKAEILSAEGKEDPELERQRDTLGQSLDPAWMMYVTTLGHSFRVGAPDRNFFDCEPWQLPFTEPIGLRGGLMTFGSQFRDPEQWDPNLAKDIQFLCGMKWGDCYYGAASISMHPFVCELDFDGELTGREVLTALKARDFRSDFIDNLDSTSIRYPGYHPGDGTGHVNDEVHNDFSGQKLFQRENGEESEEDQIGVVDEFSGNHGDLKRAVVDGQLWYVLLHIAPETEEDDDYVFSNYVVLFAVGKSLTGPRLIGVVTHQVCHNLCD